jgi:YD repeat-containing protein
LAVILVVQIALIVFVFWPQSLAEGTGGPLLPDFTAADVISLTIQDSDGNRVVLAKDGDAWVLPEGGSYPANGEKIMPFLEKFAGVQTNRLVTETEGSHKRLRVSPDNFNRMVEVTLRDGSKQQVYVGNSAGTGATHIRAGNQPQVYLTGEVQAFEVDPQASNWINAQYYTLPQTATVALTLQNQNGTFEFERDGETWTMNGLTGDEEFAKNNLTTVLNQASTIRMTSPSGKAEQPSFGLDNPTAVVTFKTQDGNEHTLLIGAQNETDNNYIVKWSDSPYYVWVAEFTVKELVERGRDDFLLPPPTAESEGASTDPGQ